MPRSSSDRMSEWLLLGLCAAARGIGGARAQTIQNERGDAFGVVETSSVVGSATQGVPGYTTYRLALKLNNDAKSVYTIFGHAAGPMNFPSAFQVPPPFGCNLAGTQPAFWQLDKRSQYDSWLTVGMTNGDSPSALSIIGEDIAAWSETKALNTVDGAVFWMNPEHGPTISDTNGKEGKGSPQGNVVIAQLTVKTGTTVDAQVNAQGHTNHGNSWRTLNIKYHIAPNGGAGRAGSVPCNKMQLATANMCVAQCLACGGRFSSLASIVTDHTTRKSCRMPSGEEATQAMQLAVQHCGLCGTGEYKQLNHQGCTPCPAGTYKDTAGNEPCQKCPVGWAVQGGNAGTRTTCVACAKSEFIDKATGNCRACPAGKVPDSNADACFAMSVPPPPTPPPPPPPPTTATPGATGGLPTCQDAAALAMVTCCAPGMNLLTAEAHTSTLLYTCMSVANDLTKMCGNPSCVQTLQSLDQACENTHEDQMVKSGAQTRQFC